MALTQSAAINLGHKLELCRSVARLSLRDVGQAAGISPQYLNNIEKGSRLAPSENVLNRMRSAYMLPQGAMDDLLFEARIKSALEQRGIPEAVRNDFYAQCEQKFTEAGFPIVSDVAEIIRRMLSQ
jgi:transcriptional regulator with XRE-family HTH domain